MKSLAAVALEKQKPLEIETVDLEGPKPGESWFAWLPRGCVIQMLLL